MTGAYGQIGRDFMPILRQLFGESNVIASDIAKPTASKVVETYDNLKTIELESRPNGSHTNLWNMRHSSRSSKGLRLCISSEMSVP